MVSERQLTVESNSFQIGTNPMPLSPRIARFNRRFTNRAALKVVPWLPGFGVVHHIGRSSGKRYRTPIKLFRHGDEFLIALTYGPGSDWVRNLKAEGGCVVEFRNGSVHLSDPRLIRDPERRGMPIGIRQILGMMGVGDFLALTRSTSEPSKTESNNS
jgi:deazaflavin-dependent oxidoreductase (nitroreductase family)